MSDQPQPKRPEVGEQTGAQKKDGVSINDIFGSAVQYKGYDAPPPGTIETYRRMRGNPTIALARTVATMPIRTADIAFEAENNVDDERVEFVQGVIEPLWPRLLKDLLFALDFGYSAFEKVWEVQDGKLVYGKLKALLPEITEIQEDKESGSFAGLKNGKVILPPESCYLFSYDDEPGHPYGRSRNENVRKVWSEWDQAVGKEGQYVTKVSAVIPTVEYPEGRSQDSQGNEKDNFELAKRVLEQLCSGRGVAMPNVLAQYAHDLIRSGVDITKLKAWTISFLETQGQHGAELDVILRHKESLMMRGWLVPERAAIEGQQGTKAEASSHADIGVAVAELVLNDILRSANDYLINPLLVYNYGPKAKGTVYLSTAGLTAEQKAFTRTIISGVITQPGNIDLFLRLIDYDALLDQVGLPKQGEIADAGDWQPPSTANPEEAKANIEKQASMILRSISQHRMRRR